MKKKKIIAPPKNTKKSGLIYFFLIPILFLTLYVAGQPQTYVQEAGSDKKKHEGEGGATAPTFTPIGDCVANQNCPTPDPANATNPNVGGTQPAAGGEQPDVSTHSKSKGKEKKKKGKENELITQIEALLKELGSPKCEKKRYSKSEVDAGYEINESEYSDTEYSDNRRKRHRHKKYNERRGLAKLLKCLQKLAKEKGGQTGTPPATGGTQPGTGETQPPAGEQPAAGEPTIEIVPSNPPPPTVAP